jgi:peptidoglycan hydrolase CwlO-like protein
MTTNESLLSTIAAFVVAISAAATGLLIAVGKLRIIKHKESSATVVLKPHEQVLKEHPIFHYVERDMQRAQSQIDELQDKVQSLEVKIERLEGALNTLRAELKK